MVKTDYKKSSKELYCPKNEPSKIVVPAMSFIMADGAGNPNDENGEYQKVVELLYALSYTIKMSAKSGNAPKAYFDYVVPPLEGLWWLSSDDGFDFTQKERFCWTSMIRQPEFVTAEVFAWACAEVKRKKPHLPVDKARLEAFDEGLCVQCMHIGKFDDEPKTLKKMESYIIQNKLINDISSMQNGAVRRHHEIYLSDPRKTAADKMKTVLRIPVRSEQ